MTSHEPTRLSYVAVPRATAVFVGFTVVAQRAEQSRAEQSRAEQSRAEQSRGI